MNQEELLAQLIDVYAPHEISWWPLAPGWWLLISLLIALTFAITYFVYSTHRKTLWKRQALKKLSQISNEKNRDSQLNIQIIKLIKEALYAKTRNIESFSATGDNFIQLVLKVDKHAQLSDRLPALMQDLYKQTSVVVDEETLLCVKKWIKGL